MRRCCFSGNHLCCVSPKHFCPLVGWRQHEKFRPRFRFSRPSNRIFTHSCYCISGFHHSCPFWCSSQLLNLFTTVASPSPEADDQKSQKIPANEESPAATCRTKPTITALLLIRLNKGQLKQPGGNVVGSVRSRAAELLWSDSTGLSDQPSQALTPLWFRAERSSKIRESQRPEVKSRRDKRRRRPSTAPCHSKASDQSIKSAKQRLRKRKRQSGYVGKAPGAPYSRAVVSCGSAICKAKHSQGKMGREKNAH